MGNLECRSENRRCEAENTVILKAREAKKEKEMLLSVIFQFWQNSQSQVYANPYIKRYE